MRISQVKGNGNYKIHLNAKELNAITIAIANLSIPDMEDEAKEQGLDTKEISYAHLELFEKLSDVTGLYPLKSTPDFERAKAITDEILAEASSQELPFETRMPQMLL